MTVNFSLKVWHLHAMSWAAGFVAGFVLTGIDFGLARIFFLLISLIIWLIFNVVMLVVAYDGDALDDLVSNKDGD